MRICLLLLGLSLTAQAVEPQQFNSIDDESMRDFRGQLTPAQLEMLRVTNPNQFTKPPTPVQRPLPAGNKNNPGLDGLPYQRDPSPRLPNETRGVERHTLSPRLPNESGGVSRGFVTPQLPNETGGVGYVAPRPTYTNVPSSGTHTGNRRVKVKPGAPRGMRYIELE